MGWTYLPDDVHDTLNRLAYDTHTPPDVILVTLINQASQGTPLMAWPVHLLETVAACDPDLVEWLLGEMS